MSAFGVRTETLCSVIILPLMTHSRPQTSKPAHHLANGGAVPAMAAAGAFLMWVNPGRSSRVDYYALRLSEWACAERRSL
jgi:hypothetical protein